MRSKAIDFLDIDEMTLYRGKPIKISAHLTLKQPTLDDICDIGEKQYFAEIGKICATPSDYKSELYDGFNLWWDEVDDFDFFTLIYKSIDSDILSLLFEEDINLQRMVLVKDNTSQDIKLINTNTQLIIDRFVYEIIVNYIRKIHRLKKHEEKGGNTTTKRFMVDEDRDNKKYARKEHQKAQSTLLPIVSALTNHANFKYSYSTVWSLPIYVLMDAADRINAINDYENIMTGYYSGCVDLKKISNKSVLNWMRNL